MKFIDIHTHVYPNAIARKAADNVRNFYHIGSDMDGTADMLLRRGQLAGISQYVILPVAIRPENVPSINHFIVEEVHSHPCFIGFGTIHAGMENVAEEAEKIGALGLKGIKIHPDCQKFNIDDPRLFPVYEAIQGRLPILLHMGDKRYDYSHPARLRRVLEQFPKLQAVAAHFGGYSIQEIACQELKDTNCIMDISSSLMFMAPGEAERYINLYGAERLAFGTDYPVWDPVEEVERFLSLNLTMEQKEQIAWKTASQFLDL